MKKIISLLIACFMLFAFAACAQPDGEKDNTGNTQSESETGSETGETTGTIDQTNLLGGYKLAESIEITEDIQAIFDKAIAKTTFAPGECVPLALVATQVVAGMNYQIFTRFVPPLKGAPANFYNLIIYADLQGDATVTELIESSFQVSDFMADPVPGGWTYDVAPAVTDEVKDSFVKISEADEEKEYTPIALIGEQVVAGMNYCVLCQVADKKSNSLPILQIIVIYSAIDGHAEITDVYDFLEGTPSES
ncbi:MAG: hypothetical protein II149_03410 [Clostridia bacterium]|nr:hypothetical protein [Clostridia bacterium]